MYQPFQQLSGWENAISNITSNQNNNQSSSTILEVDARAEAGGNNNKVRLSDSCLRFEFLLGVICFLIVIK